MIDKIDKEDIMENSKLPIEQLINLEIWLMKNYPEQIHGDDLQMYFSEFFSEIEVDYLMNACIMPYININEELQMYDTTKPKLDELKFIKDLQTKYNVDEKQIITRIRTIRSINKYLIKHHKNVDQSEINEFKKLVLKN